MGNSEKEYLTEQINREIIVRREAQLETREAFEHYEEISEGLGFEFMRSLDAAVQTLKRNPLAFQKIYKDVRRVLIRKFPYALFYIAEETALS